MVLTQDNRALIVFTDENDNSLEIAKNVKMIVFMDHLKKQT